MTGWRREDAQPRALLAYAPSLAAFTVLGLAVIWLSQRAGVLDFFINEATLALVLMSVVFQVVGFWYVGFGIGFTMQTVLLVAQNEVEPRDIGVATSTTFLARQMGGTIALAALGGLLNNRLAYWIPRLTPSDADLDLPLFQRIEHLTPGRHPDLDVDGRVAPVQACDRLVEFRRNQTGYDLDANDPLDPLGRLGDLVRHHLRRFEHVLAQRHHSLAGRRHFHAGRRAMEQRHADMILQPLERGADARLLAVELPRRRTDPAGADDVDEGTHQVPVDAARKPLVD